MVGGLLVKSATEENPLTHKGVSVKNKFAYTMSVVLKEEGDFEFCSKDQISEESISHFELD